MLHRASGRLALLAVIVSLCAIRAYVGLIGTRDFSHDAFMLLDGAWRMLNGQRPHIDFYSHLGFLTYLPTEIGLRISRGAAWGLGYGQALAGLLLGLWAFLLGRRRLADVPLVLMCISVVLMAIAPFALGFSPMKPTPAMVYNRQGYAFIALVLLEAFQPAKQGRGREDLWGGFSSGAILAILFFLKITYFAVASFLIVALLPCRGQSRQRWTGIVAGGIVLTTACCAYYGFQTQPLVHDLITLGGGKHIRFGWYIIDGILQGAGIAATLALSAALLLSVYKDAKTASALALAGLAVAFAGTVMILGNAERDGFPMAVFLAIVVLNAVNLQIPVTRTRPDYFHVSVLLLGSVLIVGSLLSGMIGMTFALGQRMLLHHTKAFNMPRLSGFTTGPDDDWYAELVNNGVPLIEKFRRPTDTLMSLDFTNPFSYGFGMRPAYGGTPVFQYGTTFNDRFKPTPEFLMGSADMVAVPKKASDPTLDDNVPRLYGPYLKSHYHLLGESRDWRLYRRNGE